MVIGAVVLVAAVVFQPEMLVFLIFAIGGPAVAVGTRILALFDFTVAESPDGLRLRSGLLSTQHQTVPPGRVQAVRISQPVLWRGRDWVRLEVNVLGNTTGRSAQRRGHRCPAARRPPAGGPPRAVPRAAGRRRGGPGLAAGARAVPAPGAAAAPPARVRR